MAFFAWLGTIANSPFHLRSGRTLTDPRISARSQSWLRALLYGFFAELATVLTIILIVVTYRYVVATGAPAADYAAFGLRTGEIVGIIGGAVYTFLLARLLMNRVSSEFVTHGLVVAATAIVFSVGGSLLGHHGVPAGYLLASVLKLASGALAGFLARGRQLLIDPA